MSNLEQEVRTLVEAFGLTLIKSSTKNPLSRSFRRYCLWWEESSHDGPLHNATLPEVHAYLRDSMDEFLRSRSAGE